LHGILIFPSFTSIHTHNTFCCSTNVKQSFTNAGFYEAPPSEMNNELWLVGWTSVLWLVNRFKLVLEMSESPTINSFKTLVKNLILFCICLAQEIFNWEIRVCSWKKTQDYNRRFQFGSSETVFTEVESNSLWIEFVALQTFFTLKQQHNTVKKDDNVTKHKEPRNQIW